MGDEASTLLRPRRIGVTGAMPWQNVKITQAFCAAVGTTLIKRNAVIVTRGGKAQSSDVAANSKGQVSGRRRRPVDDLVVNAACEALEAGGKRPESAIETVLSEVASDRELFHIGMLTRVRGQTYEAERFAFVARLDGLIGIAGRGGTEQTLVLALATERPILPVPVFDRAGLKVWEQHESVLTETLRLKKGEVQRWKRKPASAKAAAELGAEMVNKFLDSMARHCFVIMPFQESHTALYDFVIEPAVKGMGDRPIRTDRIGIPGDVGRQIDEGIQRADYVIVVLDGLRPNVLYELGLAHGRGKPTILMSRRDSLEADTVPFDLTMQQRLEYDQVDGSLPERLQDAIRTLGRL